MSTMPNQVWITPAQVTALEDLVAEHEDATHVLLEGQGRDVVYAGLKRREPTGMVYDVRSVLLNQNGERLAV